MANTCSVYLTLDFDNEVKKEATIMDLNQLNNIANIEDSGIFIGESRYLFDAEVSDNGPFSMSVQGWTKWDVGSRAVLEFYNRYLQHRGITSFLLEYEEASDMLFGQFYTEGDRIYLKHLPHNDEAWGACNEDNYYDNLEVALDNGGVISVIN